MARIRGSVSATCTVEYYDNDVLVSMSATWTRGVDEVTL